MNFLRIAVLIGATLLLATGVQAKQRSGTYHYSVRIPAGGQTCQAEAEILKSQFSKVSKVEVTSSICREAVNIQAEGSPYILYSILLTYQADQEIKPYSASFGTAGIFSAPDNYGGIYLTYKECLDDIHVQTQNFQAATQLVAIDAFCSPADGDDSVVYRLQIDGIGKKVQSLYIFNAAFAGLEDEQTKSDVEKMINQLGGSVTKDLGSQVYYYAPSPLQIRNSLLGFFKNKDECTSQLTDANEIFAKARAKNIIARCLEVSLRSKKVEAHSYSLEVVNDRPEVSQDYGLNYKYYTFGECMTDKARVLVDAGKWAYGGICSPTLDLTGQYSLNIFRGR